MATGRGRFHPSVSRSTIPVECFGLCRSFGQTDLGDFDHALLGAPPGVCDGRTAVGTATVGSVLVGKFPWRIPAAYRACHDSVHVRTPARILSPFTDVSEEVIIGQDSTIEEVRVQLTGAEPLWSFSILPVWPAIWQPTAVFTPVPTCSELVCVAVVSPGWQMALFLPRRADLLWVLNYIRRLTPGPVMSVRAPLAAQPAGGGPSEPRLAQWRCASCIPAG